MGVWNKLFSFRINHEDERIIKKEWKSISRGSRRKEKKLSCCIHFLGGETGLGMYHQHFTPLASEAWFKGFLPQLQTIVVWILPLALRFFSVNENYQSVVVHSRAIDGFRSTRWPIELEMNKWWLNLSSTFSEHFFLSKVNLSIKKSREDCDVSYQISWSLSYVLFSLLSHNCDDELLCLLSTFLPSPVHNSIQDSIFLFAELESF